MQLRSYDERYIVRMPTGWREAIKTAAVQNRRSMNQEILAALESVVNKATAGGEFGDQAPAVVRNETALPGGSIINPGIGAA